MGKTIQIDGQKLRALLKERKINAAQASRDIGMTDSYVSNCIGYNYIAKAPAMLLEAKYGVMMDDYKYVEPEPVKPAEQPVEAAPVAVVPQSCMTEDDWSRIAGMINSTAIDYDQLTKVIMSAVFEAVSMLLAAEPLTKKMQTMLYAAIKGALSKIASERK